LRLINGNRPRSRDLVVVTLFRKKEPRESEEQKKQKRGEKSASRYVKPKTDMIINGCRAVGRGNLFPSSTTPKRTFRKLQGRGCRKCQW